MIVLHHPTKRDLGITIGETRKKAPEGYYVQTVAEDGEGNRGFVGPFNTYASAIEGRREYKRLTKAIDKAGDEINRLENGFGTGSFQDGQRRDRIEALKEELRTMHRRRSTLADA